jgi:hypothetical protein
MWFAKMKLGHTYPSFSTYENSTQLPGLSLKMDSMVEKNLKNTFEISFSGEMKEKIL